MVKSTVAGKGMKDITVNGHQVFDGAVIADNIRIHGNGRFLEGLSSQQLRIIGSCSIKGNTSVKHIYCQGHGKFHTLQVETIQVAGSIAAEHVSGANLIDIKGSLQIKGSLEAVNVTIRQQGTASVNRITAEKSVVIQADRLSILHWLWPRSRRGTYHVLKGYEVKVDHIQSSLIVGGYVEIGPNCAIHKVIYSEYLSVALGAKVAEVIHLSQHPQIWRSELC